MKSHSWLCLALASSFIVGCEGPDAEAETSRLAEQRRSNRSSSSTPGEITDLSAITVTIGGKEWTGFSCPQKVIRGFRNPATGTVPLIPAMCILDGAARPSLEIQVQGSLVNYATGTWSGREIRQRVAVDFEAGGYEFDSRRDAIDSASSVTISTWDREGLVKGELDLVLAGASDTATIRGPFSIAFSVR
jgi:hypothetical protein